jgi:hypothetical protein
MAKPYSEKDNLKTLLKASYESAKDARNTLRDAGYTLDQQLSNINTKVFTDQMGKPHITFRGSVRLVDWLRDDPLIAMGYGKFAPRVKEAQKITKEVEAKYNQPASVFGNSLGGALAEKSGASGKIVTHNKAMSISDIGKTIPKNQTDIRSLQDPVSILALTQKHQGRFVNTVPIMGLKDSHLYTSLPNGFMV